MDRLMVGDTEPVHRLGGGKIPTARQALLLVLVVLILCATAGTAFQLADLVRGILATEVLCILVPLGIALSAGRFSAGRTLGLHWPGWSSLGVAALAAPAAAVVAGEAFWLQSRLVPVPVWYVEMMERLTLGARQSGPWMGVLTLSVFPALGEEGLFRGFVLSGLKTRLSSGAAVLASALLFALVHIDPYRFLAVGLLGVFLGFVALWTRSLYPVLLVHALNNLLALVPPKWAQDAGPDWLEGNHSAPAGWILLCGTVLAGACVFLWKNGKKDPSAFGRDAGARVEADAPR